MDERTIRLLTLMVRLYRELRNRGICDVPIEIRGLKGKALKGAAMFDRLNRAYDKLIETGDAHATDVEGLAPQIDAMQDDITFAVQTLGNSAGVGVHDLQPQPVVSQISGAVPQLPQAKITAPAAPPAVGNDNATFPADGTR